MRMRRDCWNISKAGQSLTPTRKSRFISKCPKRSFRGDTSKRLPTMDPLMWLNSHRTLRGTTRTSMKAWTHPRVFTKDRNSRLRNLKKSLCSIWTLRYLFHLTISNCTSLSHTLRRLTTISNSCPSITWTLNNLCSRWNSNSKVGTIIDTSGTNTKPRCSTLCFKTECWIRWWIKEWPFQTPK